jgi:hypothetical protein
MKRILLNTAAVFLLVGMTNAQDEINFYKENLALYAGVGVFPYGLNTLSSYSEEQSAESSHLRSNVIGVSYHLKRKNVGAFFEVSRNQQRRTTEAMPFNSYLDFSATNARITYFYVRSNSYNLGLLFGNEVAPGLELYAKLGVGTSYHEYDAIVESSSAPFVYYTDQTQKTLNYQFGMEIKYFALNVVGVKYSFAISDNFPVFSLGIIGRLPNKE